MTWQGGRKAHDLKGPTMIAVNAGPPSCRVRAKRASACHPSFWLQAKTSHLKLESQDRYAAYSHVASVLQGETVPYIVCVKASEDGKPSTGPDASLAERAYHPEEVNASPCLSVDKHYYLAHQVCPGTLTSTKEPVRHARAPRALPYNPLWTFGGKGNLQNTYMLGVW